MQKKEYKEEIKGLQEELVQLQQWVKKEGKRVVILFEGRDASSKGGTIKRITQRLNPHMVKVIAKGKPTPKEESQKYFTRWRKTLPKGGEIVIYDRSWYTRAGVESVMGFASVEEVSKFYTDVKKFERKLHKEGVIILKYWLSITQTTQELRFHDRLNNLAKRWKLSPMDLASRDKWDEYTTAKEVMFNKSNFSFAPWRVIDANEKRACRCNVIDDILTRVPFVPEELKPSALPPLKTTNR